LPAEEVNHQRGTKVIERQMLEAETRTPAPFADEPVEALIQLLRGRRVVVLAGAGCSTESGIPDYRGAGAGRRSRAPVQYRDFVRSPDARIRYWSRSVFGWTRIAAARPNAAHLALANLEAAGAIQGIITQNVDGLHQAAGSRRLIELHGSLAAVRCLGCGERSSRAEFQRRLEALNPEWLSGFARGGRAHAAPDGDADLPEPEISTFHVPPCEACTGIIKPDVVFFGENVPASTVAEAWDLFAEAEVLLVTGSSLTVYSGRRFIYRAVESAMPIGVINLGPTRADEVAAAKLEARLGESLPEIARELV
jgi:NAD+-dependent protein deacetylase sirtuin 4